MLAIKENGTVKRRSKGEQTRNNILVAAIEILAKKGIKGTTHRAIAGHAGIQLSLTTYYFKDIQELVHQAFRLNSDNITQHTYYTWIDIFDFLKSIGKTQLKKVSVKTALREQFSQLATEHIVNKVTEQPIELAVEQLLFTEIQTTPQLRELASHHKNMLIAPYVNLCRYFDQEYAEIDADILFTVFTKIEYKNIMLPLADINRDAIYQEVNRMIGWIMKLK